MAQLTVAAKVQAAINAEARIPHRIAMACFADICRIAAIARFIEFPLSYIIGIPRRMADKRFVLIRKDSSGGLMENGGSVAWTEPPREMDMDGKGQRR